MGGAKKKISQNQKTLQKPTKTQSETNEFKNQNLRKVETTNSAQENAKSGEEGYDPSNDRDVKLFQENICKFKDSLVASTSANSEEIQIWEPKTLAPYEPILEKKFYVGSNTLCVNSQNYIWASHSHKNIMNVWRWDKKEAVLRFPVKDQLNVFRMAAQDSNIAAICVGGSKKGLLSVWQASTGQLLADIESAHYMEINDLDISKTNSDMVITGGKDCKVKIWLMSALLSNENQNQEACFAEFGEHSQEVTQVAFSSNNSSRAFSASIDKQYKVYDVPSKICIKTIQTQSPILKFVMDYTESNLYIACDNQNIYCYGMESQQIQSIDSQQGKSRQKRTLQHKHKVTALCLSVDGQHLVSGDQTGVIYVWSTQNIHQPDQGSPRNDSPQTNNINSGLLSTFDLHKDKGPITNLLPLIRPLSLFGLTANMKAFEVAEIMPLQKFKADKRDQSTPAELNIEVKEFLRAEESMEQQIQMAEEDNYFMQAAQNLLAKSTSEAPKSGMKNGSHKTQPAQIRQGSNSGGQTEIEQLREENKKLKRTLSERFDEMF